MSDWTISDAYSAQKNDLIMLEFGLTLYESLNKETNIARSVQDLRRTLMQTYGLYIPSIRIKVGTPPQDDYLIRIRGQIVGQATMHPPLCFSTKTQTDTPGVHPITQQPGSWTETGDETAQQLLLKHVQTMLERKAPELLTYETTVRWLQQAKSHVPALIKELEKKSLTPGLLWQVMRRLLKQRIPLHPFEDLLEMIMEFFIVHPPHGYAPPEWSHAHPDEIVKYIAAQKKKRLPGQPRSGTVVRHLKR